MVTYVYNHATIGDGLAALSSIREPDVNLSIARNVVDPETVAYLHDIDWQGHFQSAWSAAPPPPGREGICNHNCFACPLMPFHGDRMVIKPADFGVFNVADTQEVIRAGLHAFPKNSGLGALEQPLIHAEPTHPVTKSERAMRLLLTMDKV